MTCIFISINTYQVQIYTQLDSVPKEISEEMRSKMRPMHVPFGVVEYDSVASAIKASLELTDQSDWRRGMRVELVVKVKKNPNVEGIDKENKSNGGWWLMLSSWWRVAKWFMLVGWILNNCLVNFYSK